MKDMDRMRRRGGFTLAELLVVVAIIAVLVGIAIPVFSAQLEKTRRAVDMATARQIEAALAVAYNLGDFECPEGKNNLGVWVMLSNGRDKAPRDYGDVRGKGIFCGADKGMILDGVVNTREDMIYNNRVEQTLTDAGLDPATLHARSDGSSGGWDWIIIQVGRDNDGKLYTRFYSGFKGGNSAVKNIPVGSTNIEKAMGAAN